MMHVRVLALLAVLASVGAALVLPSPAMAQTAWDGTILGATTRDMNGGSGDGFIDRIEIQTPANLSDATASYANAVVRVENYSVNRIDSCGTTGDDLFCVYVAQQTIFDTAAFPRVRVENSGGLSLVSAATAASNEVVARDGASPFAGYTLAIAGRNEIYIRFSEPVYRDALGSPLNTSVFGLRTAGTLAITSIRNGDGGSGGNQNVLLVLNTTVMPMHIYDTPRPQAQVVITSTIYDAQGNVLSAPPSMPFSRLVLGNAENVLLQPVLAYNSLAPADRIDSGATQPAVGVLRTFDGSRSIAPEGSLMLQISRSTNISDTPVLIADTDVDSRLVRNGLWLPFELSDLVPGTNSTGIISLNGTATGGNQLVEYEITEEQLGGDESLFQFLFRDDSNNYFAAVTDPTSPNWYTSVRPYTFVVRQPASQRADISILNNVINPLDGDRAAIQYRLEQTATVSITVFNLAGDIVRVLQRGSQRPGNHIVEWNGRNSRGRPVARGIYFIRFVSSDTDEYRKVLVVK